MRDYRINNLAFSTNKLQGRIKRRIRGNQWNEREFLKTDFLKNYAKLYSRTHLGNKTISKSKERITTKVRIMFTCFIRRGKALGLESSTWKSRTNSIS